MSIPVLVSIVSFFWEQLSVSVNSANEDDTLNLNDNNENLKLEKKKKKNNLKNPSLHQLHVYFSSKTMYCSLVSGILCNNKGCTVNKNTRALKVDISIHKEIWEDEY